MRRLFNDNVVIDNYDNDDLIVDLKADVLTVAQRMGHGDPSVTLNVYEHLFGGAQQKLTDQLDARGESTPDSVSSAEFIDIAGAARGSRRLSEETQRKAG